MYKYILRILGPAFLLQVFLLKINRQVDFFSTQIVQAVEVPME